MELEHGKIKDHRKESSLITRRTIVTGVLCVLAVVALMAQMVRLQVVDHHHYVTLSQENRVKISPVPPTRGLIFDRDGTLLAENQPSHRLVVTPERVPDLAEALDRVAELIELTESDRERFEELLTRSRHFEELPLRTRLTDEEVAKLAAHRHELPGMEVRAQLVRHYPEATHAAHSIGYVGRISPRELRRIDRSRYRGTSHIGKGGVEAAYEEVLHGNVGFKRVETNALGRVLRTLERESPEPGDDIYLTLDSGLQSVAERALGDHRGAAVAMDPRTGEILAKANTPRFDPNLFVEGMSHSEFEELEAGGWQPLFNRATRGHYSPASTIKPFVAIAALEEGIVTPEDKIRCDGEFFLEARERPYRCWREEGHGEVDMRAALAQSSNVFFYEVGFELGIDAMGEHLAPFGFGERTGVDLVGERSGVLPSRDWKRRNLGGGWFHGETVISSIGLGYFLTTPLQLANATATLANRGERVTPQMVHSIRDGTNGETREPLPVPRERIELSDPGHWEYVIDGMRDAVRHPRGTARSIGWQLDYDMVGKTGTAQVAALDDEEDYEHDERPEHLRDHALFTGFAPADDPEIVVAVVIEHGGSGGAAAAPVARAIADVWLKDDYTYLEEMEQDRLDVIEELQDEEQGVEGLTP